MHLVRLQAVDDFDGWRAAARSLAAAGVPADRVTWQVGDGPADLFGGGAVPPGESGSLFVSRDFVTLARRAILHRDPQRFPLLYALLLRVVAEPRVMRDPADSQLRRIEELARAVARDIHKMRAFVRFREIDDGNGTGSRFVAWFEPEHHILRANAGFFVSRFFNMRWSILTPAGSMHWDGATLTEGPPAARGDAPGGDPVEGAWKAYYAAVFNPARLMTGAMLKEMPRKYWKNMPETALVPDLIAGARKRELGMIEQARAAPGKGHGPATIELLRDEARTCRRCPLWQPATQTVFGQGPHDAEIMFVGEQPGDVEDRSGQPFVGPAGEVFDRALAAAGIDRGRVYLTNAVKHFKFEQRGKRRIHARPGVGEIEACRWWVDQERAIVRPRLIVAMGATAARSLLGRPVAIQRERGAPVALDDGTPAWITVHPSYLLRLPPDADHAAEFDRYVTDLRNAVASIGAAP